jgi:hypothetical protein
MLQGVIEYIYNNGKQKKHFLYEEITILLEPIKELTCITSTMNRILKTAAYAGWFGLGFYRGIKAYNYSYNKYNKDESYMYIYSMGHGCRGSFYYLLFFPIMIHKEIYRFEVNIRNIEKEKESRYYNELI